MTQNKSKKSPRIFEKIQERVINDLSNNGEIFNFSQNFIFSSFLNQSFLFHLNHVIFVQLRQFVFTENSQPPKKKRKGILGEIFGEIDLESEEGKKLIAMKSENNHLVQMVNISL